MKRMIIVFTIFIAMITLVWYAATEKKETIKGTHYEITASLDVERQKLVASETLRFENTYDALDTVRFYLFADANNAVETQNVVYRSANEAILVEEGRPQEDLLGGIDIKSVLVDENPVRFEEMDQGLVVYLDQTLDEGEGITIHIDYELDFPYGINRLSYYKETYSGVHWYPVLAKYEDGRWDERIYSTMFESDYYEMADFDIALTVPSDYTVQLTGNSEETIDGNEKTVTSYIESIREVVFFASPKYMVYEETRDLLTIRFYYLDESKSEVVKNYADSAFQIIKFFETKIGPYPYGIVDIVESNIEGFAIEYPACIQLGKMKALDNPYKNYDFIHEIAHQWFHGIIGSDAEKHGVMDEGFSDFYTYYYYNEKFGFNDGFPRMLHTTHFEWPLPINSPLDVVGEQWHLYYYQGGRTILYDLYMKLGQETFDEIMQAYYKAYKFENVILDDFIAVVEAFDEQAASYMQDAFNRPNYQFPKAFNLTPDEKRRLTYTDNLPKLMVIYEGENAPELAFGKIITRTSKGEPLKIIVDADLSERENLALEMFEKELGLMGFKYEVLRTCDEEMLKGANALVLTDEDDSQLFEGAFQSFELSEQYDYGAQIYPSPISEDRFTMVVYINNDTDVEAFVQSIIQKMVSVNEQFYEYIYYDLEGNVIDEKYQINPNL